MDGVVRRLWITIIERGHIPSNQNKEKEEKKKGKK